MKLVADYMDHTRPQYFATAAALRRCILIHTTDPGLSENFYMYSMKQFEAKLAYAREQYAKGVFGLDDI
jgi:hypothetical protein